jgi:hypothetical protein
MKYSTTKNTIQHGVQIAFVEIGDVLYFDADRQFQVTEIRGSRPFNNETDLFQLWKDTGIHPVVLTNQEF